MLTQCTLRSGEPTLDPTEALKGSQLPFGGHKGASIAIMVELMASVMTIRINCVSKWSDVTFTTGIDGVTVFVRGTH